MNLHENNEYTSLILNNSETTVFRELKDSLETCKSFYFNVAFINYGGLQLFLSLLNELHEKNISGKVITSTYLNFSDPKALKKLFTFKNVELKVYDDIKSRGFHSKAYLFEYEDYYKIIIGSSNLTCSALKSNIEWNVKIISKKNDPFLLDVLDEFTDIWDQLDNVTESFLDEYELVIKKIREHNKALQQLSYTNYSYEITPNIMQQRAIENLHKIRKYNGKKGLVIAATGTGKTYMSAFDVKQLHPKKVLFIVHREDILRKAEESFKKVIGTTISTGFFTGSNKSYDSKYIFSTIQTLHKHCAMFDTDEFDYIIIDEAHHIAGETYQKILKYFNPKFLLGMTATPERCDNFDIFEAFDNNVALEVRLHEAMEEELVSPFHYFGIADIEQSSLEGVKLDNISEIVKRLKINQRVDFIIEQMGLYGHDGEKRKCLGFCVNIDHAMFMSEEFNKRGIPSVCLYGNDKISTRKAYTDRLENNDDPLEVIFTIDIFNEGIDIPSVNLVLMLRPTNSPIIFIQQLGRGLRKSDDKEYLTVLDFIGNHNRAFLIALALKGNRYYDKDSLKVSVANEFIDIPGETYVQLDRISKERILNQIENENFNSMRYLKEDYLSFKSLLKGKPPYYLMDYLKFEGAPDPIKFIKAYSAKGGYIHFLANIEKDEKYAALLIDDEFTKSLKYLSDMLPLKRPYEFAILLDLLFKEKMNLDDCRNAILKYIEEVDNDSVLHAMQILNFNYYDIAQRNKWTQFCSLDNNEITLDKSIQALLLNKEKKPYIIDALRYGLNRYKNEFEEKNYGLPFFRMYASYSMQEVGLMSNLRKVLSSFRGNGLLSNGNHYFLFVNLHKDGNIKELINYKDKFLNKKYFQWQSPYNTKQSSERGKNIIFNQDRGIYLHLFIRKFEKIDNQDQPFIYVGKINTKKHEGECPITIQARLEHELPANLFEELTNKVEVRKNSTN